MNVTNQEREYGMLIRLELKKDFWKFGIVSARIVKTGKTGSIDKKYLSASKKKELVENGYAYINQPQERVV